MVHFLVLIICFTVPLASEPDNYIYFLGTLVLMVKLWTKGPAEGSSKGLSGALIYQ